MNIPLAIVNVVALAAALVLAYTPHLLRSTAAWLLARADFLEDVRDARRRMLERQRDLEKMMDNL